MSSRKPNNNISRLTKLYVKWGQNSLLFTLICIAWLAWRVGTKPTRLSYPCSQFALCQIVLFFTSTSVPIFNIFSRCVNYVRNREYHKVGGIALVAIILIGSFSFYQNFKENQLRIAGSGTIPLSYSAIKFESLTPELETASQYFELPSTISTNNAVVSFNYNPSIYYGGAAPYDPADNPVYNFVWETVEKLGLGSSSNPLDDLINAGDTVLIKPNWLDLGTADFTRPEVVRPLIDMAIAAGATEIYVGDGGANFARTNNVINNGGYSQMLSQLASRHPGITLQPVNLISLSYGWHWTNLGSDSSFAGSGYTHYDLAAGGATLYGHTHYSTADPQGVNPNGETLGWYAVSDKILDADVIINVPKMKTHQAMIATLSIKDLVGCALGCTYNEQAADCLPRIPHHKTSGQDQYFNNDIFWRSILDMNKIILYGDQNGVLQPTQQRKYLSVVDGIQAMEMSAHHEWGGGGIPYNRHVILAGVDPVAVDAVGCRIMGYDYRVIPSIGNADSDTVHPIGTNDPENIVIVGDAVDTDINYVFTFNSAWAGSAGALAITDFVPPAINSIDTEDNTVNANISGGLVAYILYQMDSSEYAEKMSKDGDTYSGTVPDNISGYQILAQDEYFNTAATIITAPPYQPILVVPSDGSTGISTSPTLEVTVSDPDVDNLNVTFYGRQAGTGNFVQIGTVTGITSGSNASINWNDLDSNTTYEWYVEVSDGSQSTTGPIWSFVTTTVESGILGDVNGDGFVNSTDALIVLSCDVGINTSQYCPMNCGDVNSDGLVNSTDALIILSYDVGITVPYPVGEPGCPSSVTPCPGCSH
jgi:uncharacterized protein (DUF362 family)